jgi:hypothetical protein
MELIEMIVWVVLGFFPTLGGLVLASRKLRKAGRMVLRTDVRGGEYLIGI